MIAKPRLKVFIAVTSLMTVAAVLAEPNGGGATEDNETLPGKLAAIELGSADWLQVDFEKTIRRKGRERVTVQPGEHMIYWGKRFPSMVVRLTVFHRSFIALEEAHTYRLGAESTPGMQSGYFLWAEDIDSGEIIAGTKIPKRLAPGQVNPDPMPINWLKSSLKDVTEADTVLVALRNTISEGALPTEYKDDLAARLSSTLAAVNFGVSRSGEPYWQTELDGFIQAIKTLTGPAIDTETESLDPVAAGEIISSDESSDWIARAETARALLNKLKY